MAFSFPDQAKRAAATVKMLLKMDREAAQERPRVRDIVIVDPQNSPYSRFRV